MIARNSSFTYKGRAVDVRAVGRELGVQSVLEGSIRRAGNRVRITAQLIDAGSGGHLWADRYDRDLTDIFAVQDDVTRRIVDALKVTLGPDEKARPAGGGATVNMEAYDYSLPGRELLLGNPKTRETFEKATALFRKAIEIDPNFAVANAGLGFAYMFDYQNRWSDDPDACWRSLNNTRKRRSKRTRRSHCRTLSQRWRQHSAAILSGRSPRSALRCRSIPISPWPTTSPAAFACMRENRLRRYR